MSHVYKTHWLGGRDKSRTSCGSMIRYRSTRPDLPVTEDPDSVTCWQCRHAYNFPKQPFIPGLIS